MASPHVAGAVALCLDEEGVAGPCADDGGPAGVMATMRNDARNATLRSLGTGFYGDPLRPVGSRTYGYLTVGGRPGATPAPVTQVASYRPSTVRVIAGSATAGSVSSLAADDGTRLEIAAASGSTYVAESESWTVIPSAARASLKRVAIDHDGSATSGSAAVALRAFNFRTGAWVGIDGPRTGVTSDRARTWLPGAPTDYVSAAGEVGFRVRGTRTGGSFRTRTDLVRVTIEY
jgi:hypothetical protein